MLHAIATYVFIDLLVFANSLPNNEYWFLKLSSLPKEDDATTKIQANLIFVDHSQLLSLGKVLANRNIPYQLVIWITNSEISQRIRNLHWLFISPALFSTIATLSLALRDGLVVTFLQQKQL